RGGGDGSAVARRGDDEARANCLAVTVQQSRGAVLTRRVPIACILTVTTRGVCAVAGQRDMRGDSRGAVLTTHTHTLSRSLKILSQIRSHTVCPRTGLGCVVPGTAKVY
ncbi:hypothetical protein J6590_090883, partial [Homalodisca vitripennis]